jgi:hypothetical protein
VRLQFRTADLYDDTAVLPQEQRDVISSQPSTQLKRVYCLAADSDDDNTDDAEMPPPAVDRTMVPTPSVLAGYGSYTIGDD